MQEINYAGTFQELLDSAAPSNPKNTAIAIVRLPHTVSLEPRYAIVIAGPEAEQLCRLTGGVLDQLADRLKT